MKMAYRNPRIAVQWRDLPPELLNMIAKRLPADIDVRRFRAVCHSWRSSTPPYKFPKIKLPFPFESQENSDPKHTGAHFILTERIVYRIELPDSKNPDFWLVKVEHVDDGKVRIINPVTHHRVEISPEIKMPESINILDFDVSEVCKAYALRYVNPSKPYESYDYYDYRHAKKVVYSANVDSGEYVVMAIDLEGRLWRIKSGFQKWILVRVGVRLSSFYPPFYDVAFIKGKFQATDIRGAIWTFGDKHIWKSGSYTKRRRAFKRRFVELVLNEEVVVVEEMAGRANGPCSRTFQSDEPVVDLGVYAYNCGEWLDVSAMCGCIIVVGDDCSFSVSTRGHELDKARVFFTDRYSFIQDDVDNLNDDYTGFECDCPEDMICNCYNDMETLSIDDFAASHDVIREFEGFYGHNIGLWDFGTANTGTALTFPEFSNIFWPPPAWLSRG